MVKFFNYDGDTMPISPEFPIGYVLITTVNANPSTYTIGNWEIFGQGKTLVGLDSTQTEFNTVLKTGGEKAHILSINEMPSHTHVQNAHTHASTVSAAGSHQHRIRQRNNVFANGNNDTHYSMGYHTDTSEKNPGWVTSPIEAAGSHQHSITINSSTPSNQNTGGSSSHNNLPPYITVYMWKRIS